MVHSFAHPTRWNCLAGMAGIAIQRAGNRGRNMVAYADLGLCARGALRGISTVMAGIASGGGHCRMAGSHVPPGKSCPSVARSGIARQRPRRDVAHTDGLATSGTNPSRGAAAMTAVTSSCCRGAGMRTRRAEEGSRAAMARLARRSGWNMRGGFAHHPRVLPAMAAGTTRDDAGMVHCPHGEASSIAMA